MDKIYHQFLLRLNVERDLEQITNFSSNETTMTTLVHYVDFELSRLILLILFIILTVPSVILALVMFYWMYQMPELRSRLTNHVIVSIFIVCFIQSVAELPFLLKYLTGGHVAFDSYSFCKFWIAFNYTLNTTILFLNAFLSIERYLLIFHNNTLNSHKILLHYVPMIGLMTFALIYSCLTVIFGGCQEYFSYTTQLCGGPCFQLEKALGTFDLSLTIFLPLLIIILFNAVLVFRVIIQKRRMQQRDIWKKNIRMLAQLLTVSILHLTVWLPAVTVLLIVMTNYPPPEILIDLQMSYVLINLIYLAVLGNPIVSLFAIPEFKGKIDAFLTRNRVRTVSQLADGNVNKTTSTKLTTKTNQNTM